MTERIILALHLAIGLGSVGWAVLRRAPLPGPRGPLSWVLLVVLWPFLMPAMVLTPAGAAAPSPRTMRLDALGSALSLAWTATGSTASRERAATERFVAELRRRHAALEGLAAAVATAPPRVRTRLERMREAAEEQLEQGCALLEEMLAQLTILRFSGAAALEADRAHVEVLVARLDALGALSDEQDEVA